MSVPEQGQWTKLEGLSQGQHADSRWAGEPATTNHARRRMRQRSIPPFVLDLLMQFGAEEHFHGATRYSLDKKSRRSLDRYFGSTRIKELDKLLNTYVVVSHDGKIVTVGHRTRRLRQ